MTSTEENYGKITVFFDPLYRNEEAFQGSITDVDINGVIFGTKIDSLNLSTLLVISNHEPGLENLNLGNNKMFVLNPNPMPFFPMLKPNLCKQINPYVTSPFSGAPVNLNTTQTFPITENHSYGDDASSVNTVPDLTPKAHTLLTPRVNGTLIPINLEVDFGEGRENSIADSAPTTDEVSTYGAYKISTPIASEMKSEKTWENSVLHSTPLLYDVLNPYITSFLSGAPVNLNTTQTFPITENHSYGDDASCVNTVLDLTPKAHTLLTPRVNGTLIPINLEVDFGKGRENSIADSTPTTDEVSTHVAYKILTPIASEMKSEKTRENSVLDSTPLLHEVLTPRFSEWKSESTMYNLGVCKDDFDESSYAEEVLTATPLSQKYICNEFIDKNDINHQEVSQVLKQIRISNINRVVIGHLNVNFFAAKLDAIKTVIPDGVDIMVFGETKLDNSYPNAQLLINGFGKPFRLDRNAHGGGLLIYVRSDIPCRLLNEHEFPENIEGIFVEINLRKSKWLLFGTYHPPSQNDGYYFNKVGLALDIYTKTYDKILLVGDFNTEEGESVFENFMELYDLSNLVKENTCFKSVENPSCVDLFLTNCVRSFQSTKAISTGISDCHKMIVTVMKTTFKKAKPKVIEYRSFKRFDNDIFQNELSRKIGDCTNYSDLKHGVLEVCNRHVPLKKRLVRANEVPYMTKKLRKAIANRSRLENQYYKYKTKESLRAYKKQKNFCSRLYKKERKSYYTRLDVMKVTDSKKFWKTTKPFLSDKGIGNNDIILIEGDEIFQEDSEVAGILGDFFSNAVKSLDLNIPNEYKNEVSASIDDPIDKIISVYSNHPSIMLINDNVVKGSFSFEEVSLDAIQKEIHALDGKKASMSSGIPPKILKENAKILCKPLAAIINNGISNSVFDGGLKLADVVPAHKGELTTNKKNYRNVSLLPVVSKIFEKLIHSQFSAYVEKYLSNFLCGYRKGYSAQHALICMLEKWKITLDKGGYAGGILMDLSKAFDTIDHDLLIAKLNAYGFDKKALKLIKSYLCDRWQRVKINTSYSSWSALLAGVPQGSVLGPIIFNLFINDLFYIINIDICNYADDNTPYAVDMCLDRLMTKLESAIRSAIKWFCYNGMKLNFSKCNLLVSGHKFESMICKVERTLVIETHIVKLLGIRIESELTFNKHMGIVCKKASQKLNALSRLCSFIPFRERRMLMNAFFDSQFSYSPLVWMFHSRGVNTKINNLHYRALRMIYRDETFSFIELLRKDGTVNIHHRNLQFLVTEMYKVFKDMAPPIMKDIFPKYGNAFTENVSSNTRSKLNFYNPSNTKTVKYGLETLRCLGPKLWGMVPIDTRESQTLSAFKTRIKKWIPQNCPCRLCKLFVPNLGFL